MSEPRTKKASSSSMPTCILSIDAKIRQEFRNEMDSIPSYKERISELSKLLSDGLARGDLSSRTKSNLVANIEDTKQKIESISANERFNFYVSDTAKFIEAYIKILREPVKVSFTGTTAISTSEKEKEKITAEYLEVASKYMSADMKKELEFSAPPSVKIECNNCLNKKSFEIIDGNLYICTMCGSQQSILLHTSSYKDVDRVNIATKYTYDRKVHFRDCINQYQGKQNTTIDPKIYADLEFEFEKHHLLVGDKNTPRKDRFKNIEKRHVSLFLKELEYGMKHYENINLIYTTLTGKPLDDISALENTLLEDFDQLTDLYDRKIRDGSIKIDRTSFINKHHVLFQLLHHHRHPCKKEDFPPLKTLERQILHDDICSVLFAELGWNYVPFLG